MTAMQSIDVVLASLRATTSQAGAILDDAARRAPHIADTLTPRDLSIVELSRVALTSGIPRFTWNGLDDGGRLFPGLHPATAGEVELRFAWNPERRRLYERALVDLAELRAAHPGERVRHVVGAGSFFGTDKHVPRDMDLAVFGVDDMRELRAFTGSHSTTHVYPAKGFSSGVPQNMLRYFGSDRSGAQRGMVLLDLDDLLR